MLANFAHSQEKISKTLNCSSGHVESGLLDSFCTLRCNPDGPKLPKCAFLCISISSSNFFNTICFFSSINDSIHSLHFEDRSTVKNDRVFSASESWRCHKCQLYWLISIFKLKFLPESRRNFFHECLNRKFLLSMTIRLKINRFLSLRWNTESRYFESTGFFRGDDWKFSISRCVFEMNFEYFWRNFRISKGQKCQVLLLFADHI